jgi:predicted PurR-regulated permease PerM
MKIHSEKLITEVFFFAILLASAYLVWNLFLPFLGALALAAIVVTICYPLHTFFKHKFPRLRPSILSLLSVAVVVVVVVMPVLLLSYLILGEAVSIYTLFNSPNSTAFIDAVTNAESIVQKIIPGFSVDMAKIVQQTASFFVEHLVVIFAGTASTLFLFFIALIGMYYFFKDGHYFTEYMVRLSPLSDLEDRQIMKRLANAVRSVALGTVTVALIQGVLTAVGLTIFGFDRAILLGCVAAIGALVPGVGTTIVILPSVVFLAVTGAYVPAILLAVWGVVAVGTVDNLIGPYLMSRGNNVHPFLILLSVLGGLAQFGPLGFILGPVILSLFLVLVELYHIHTKHFAGKE